MYNSATTSAAELALQDEQVRLAQLTDAYGVDITQKETRINNLQASKLRAHTELSLTETNPLLQVARRMDHVLVGQEVVAQMVLAHTMSCSVDPAMASETTSADTHSGSTAEVLRQEMKMFGLSEAHYLPTMSPIPFLPSTVLMDTSFVGGGSPVLQSVPSPLTVLLAPHRATAACIHQLHTSMRESIMTSCPCIATHAEVVPALERAMVQPMWSEPPSDFFLLKRMPAPGSEGHEVRQRPQHQPSVDGGIPGAGSSLSSGKGKLVLGTINQLVEQLTSVYFNPLSSRPQVVQDNANSFTVAFFRTYRLFLAPQALLSKLFQRFLVPSSLYVADHMDTRGVEFRAPPDLAPRVRTAFGGVEYSARSAKWLKVSQMIKVKVLCVLHHWLKECPRHFDATMLRMIMSFLEEQCFQPAAHADCPALLMQCGEFVKASAAELLIANIGGPRSLAMNPGHHGRQALAWSPIGVRKSVPPTLASLNDGHAASVESGGSLMLAPAELVGRLVAFHAHTQRSKGALLRSSVVTGGEQPADDMTSDMTTASAGDHTRRSHNFTSTFDPNGTYRAVVREFLELPLPPTMRAIIGCSRLLFRSFDVEALLEVAILGDVSSSKSTGVGARRESGRGARQQQGGGGGDNEVSVEVFVAHAERLMHWATSLVLIAAALDAVPSIPATTLPQRSVDARGDTSPQLQAVLYRLVEIATELMEQNDLHSAFGIVAGLNHPAVARLHRPLFSKRFMFHERIETLIDFFDLSTAKYANYMSHLPDDDLHPPVPFVHQCIEEVRALHDTAPSFYRVPQRNAELSQSHDAASNTGPSGVGGGWVPSEVVIHWRKFQALEGMLGDLIKYQSVPVSHGTYVEIHMMYGAGAESSSERFGTRIPPSTGTPVAAAGVINAAAVARVGSLLEASQWAPDRMITDAATLAQLSLMVHDPTRVD
jgi:hypothetical protein